MSGPVEDPGLEDGLLQDEEGVYLRYLESVRMFVVRKKGKRSVYHNIDAGIAR